VCDKFFYWSPFDVQYNIWAKTSDCSSSVVFFFFFLTDLTLPTSQPNINVPETFITHVIIFLSALLTITISLQCFGNPNPLSLLNQWTRSLPHSNSSVSHHSDSSTSALSLEAHDEGAFCCMDGWSRKRGKCSSAGRKGYRSMSIYPRMLRCIKLKRSSNV